MMLKRSIYLAVFAMSALRLAAADSGGAIDFARDIRPIFNKNCVGCHGGVKQAAKISFIYRDIVVATNSSDEKPIHPGDAEHSEIIRRLTTTNLDDRMPPQEHGAALSASEIKLLRDWIQQGATWKEHWAWVKPVASAAPKVSNAKWIRRPLDAFVLARLDAEKLKPSREADRAQWLRRVSFDLTGLAPMPEDVKFFAADKSREAYEKLVDRLLASPRFGERWATPWLDAARYADSMGYEKDPLRTVWPFRDWVIRALNDDMTFDQFTIRQLAGDLLPDATLPDQVAATFHRNTQVNTEGGTDDEEFRIAAVVDRVSTTWEVWQATTMRCVQCHSHPYEPIRHEEFYRSLAFFNTTRDWDLPSELPVLRVPLAATNNIRAWELDGKISQLRREEFAETARLAAPKEIWQPLLPTLATATRGTKLVIRTNAAGSADVLTEGTIASASKFTIELAVPENITSLGALRVDVLPLDSEKALLTPENGFVISQLRLALVTTSSSVTNLLKHGDLEITNAETASSLSSPEGGEGRGEEANASDKSNAPISSVTKTPSPQPSPRLGGVKESGTNSLPGEIKFAHCFGDEAEPLLADDSTLSPDKPGWGAFPRITHPRHAVFVPLERTALSSGAKLKLTITHEFSAGDSYASVVRRIRFSVSDRDDWEKLMASDEFKTRRQQLVRLQKQRGEIPAVSIPMMMEQDASLRRHTAVFERGNWLNKGEVVDAGVPKLFGSISGKNETNRLALARWLVSPENPLTARVAVNRVWEQLFGIGIVETVENFGSSGESPANQELLDFLALRFQNENGWSLKKLLREVVLSATYRQDARVDEKLSERDPRNRLLAHGPRTRLSAEMVRDNALAVSGLLSDKMFGPPVMPLQPDGIWNVIYSKDEWRTPKGEDAHRRALYTFIRRTTGYPSTLTFDQPSREVCVTRRLRTNTPLQSLVTLNDPVYVECAVALAARMQREGGKDLRKQIAHGCELADGVAPEKQTVAALVELHAEALKRYETNPDLAKKLSGTPKDAALTLVANAILNLDSTLTK